MMQFTLDVKWVLNEKLGGILFGGTQCKMCHSLMLKLNVSLTYNFHDT